MKKFISLIITVHLISTSIPVYSYNNRFLSPPGSVSITELLSPSYIDIGSVVPDIDPDLKELIEGMVTDIWPSIAHEIRFGSYGRPDLREKALADIITRSLTTNPLVKSLLIRNAPDPQYQNPDGKYTVAATPIDKSEGVEQHNVTVGSLFGIFNGDEKIPGNLVASFFLLRGPGLNLIGNINGTVVDFKLNEQGILEPQNSDLTMKESGSRSAIHGQRDTWMPSFREFKDEVWDKTNPKVRYSNSLADAYELLLNGGLWMEVLTPLEALEMGTLFEAAEGASLIMTPQGPIPASQINLSGFSKTFNTGNQLTAFFGSKNEIALLEEFLREKGDFANNYLVYKNIGWRSADATNAEEISLNADSPGENYTFDQRLDAMDSKGDRLPRNYDVVKIIKSILEVTLNKAIPAFLGKDLGALTGTEDASGGKALELDKIFNDWMAKALFETGVVRDIISEEFEGEIATSFTDPETSETFNGNPNSKIRILIDPLDGSSRVAGNGTVGLIKSIRIMDEEEKMIASFVISFGPQISLLFASEFEDGAREYRLREDNQFVDVGAFTIPQCRGSHRIGLALGGSPHTWQPASIQPYISWLEAAMGGYPIYSGSFVPDAFRIHIDGGIYVYPATWDGKKGVKGKLRFYETRTFGYLFEKAGGAISTGIMNSMDIALNPDFIGYPHQPEPIIIGSKDLVEEFQAYVLNSLARELHSGLISDHILDQNDLDGLISDEPYIHRFRDAKAKIYDYTGRLKRTHKKAEESLYPEEREALTDQVIALIKFQSMIEQTGIKQTMQTAREQGAIILPLPIASGTEITDSLLSSIIDGLYSDHLLAIPNGNNIRVMINVTHPEAAAYSFDNAGTQPHPNQAFFDHHSTSEEPVSRIREGALGTAH